MARRPAPFTEAALRRAIRVAKDLGVDGLRLVIRRDEVIVEKGGGEVIDATGRGRPVEQERELVL